MEDIAAGVRQWSHGMNSWSEALAHTASLVKKQKEMAAGAHFTFSLFIQFSTPDHGMEPHKFRFSLEFLMDTHGDFHFCGYSNANDTDNRD